MILKITARLQVLSKCNVGGGRGVRQVEKGHMRDFLSNTIDFDTTLVTAMKENREANDADRSQLRQSYHLLGVSVRPLPSSVRREFDIALNGWSAAPVICTTASSKSGEKSKKENRRDTCTESLGESSHEQTRKNRNGEVSHLIESSDCFGSGLSDGAHNRMSGLSKKQAQQFKSCGTGNALSDMFGAEERTS